MASRHAYEVKMTDLTRVEHTGERATDEDPREQWPRATSSNGCARQRGPGRPTLRRSGPGIAAGGSASRHHRHRRAQPCFLGRPDHPRRAVHTYRNQQTDHLRRRTPAGSARRPGREWPADGRRGRIATYYELAATSGWVLAIELDQDGLNTSSSSLAGDVFAESYRPVPHDASQLIHALRTAVSRDRRAAQNRGPLRVLSVSVSNSVDPSRSDIISLPNSRSPKA